jgi:putative oxidoreductase
MDFGLLLLRFAAGLVMAAHGAQKLFGWFGGHGLTNTAGLFEKIGFRPGRPLATAAALSELVGGLLIVTGFLGPIGPAVVLATMIVAASVHWQNGLFAMTNGIELPLLYAIVAVALGLAGYGALSLDTALGLTGFWTPAVATVALVAGVIGGLVNVARRSVQVEV